MSEGCCPCPAPAALNAPDGCVLLTPHPTLLRLLRTSPGITVSHSRWSQREQSIAPEPHREAYSKWALMFTYSRGLEHTAVRLSPRSLQQEGNSGHLIVSLRIKSQHSPNYPYSCQRTMGLPQFSPFKQMQIGQDFNTSKMSRPLSRALVLHQHVGCLARLCALLETAPNCLQPFAKGRHRGESTALHPSLSTRKTQKKA